MQRCRHLEAARGVARLLHEGDQLLDEERVATAAFPQEGDRVGVGVAIEERAHQLARRLLVERIELERDAVVLAGLGRPARLDIGARRRDQQERTVAQPREEPFAELERVVGCPMEIGEQEHEGLVQRECLEHGQRGSQRLVTSAARVDAGGLTMLRSSISLRTSTCRRRTGQTRRRWPD